MTNKKLPIILSVTAIAISVVAIFVVLFKTEPITIDSLGFFGWTTAALSAIVMILLGWNIYSLIDLNKHKRELEDLKDSTEKRISRAEGMLRTKLSFESMGMTSLLISMRTEAIERSLCEAFTQFCSPMNKDSLLVKSFAREHILQSFVDMVNGKIDKDSTLFLLSKKITRKEVEIFFHEFSSYSDKERKEKFDGVNEMLLDLLRLTS